MARQALIEQQTDISTGEIVGGKVTTYDTEVEPEFVKLYVHQWICTMSGKPNTLTDVLMGLINIGMTFAGGDGEGTGQVVRASVYEKKLIAEQLGINRRTVDNTIQKLVKIGALKRIERGTYQVNPSLIGKGSWKNIKALQVNWTFGPNGPKNDTYVTGEAES